jgi:hypothetical protein
VEGVPSIGQVDGLWRPVRFIVQVLVLFLVDAYRIQMLDAECT